MDLKIMGGARGFKNLRGMKWLEGFSSGSLFYAYKFYDFNQVASLYSWI